MTTVLRDYELLGGCLLFSSDPIRSPEPDRTDPNHCFTMLAVIHAVVCGMRYGECHL